MRCRMDTKANINGTPQQPGRAQAGVLPKRGHRGGDFRAGRAHLLREDGGARLRVAEAGQLRRRKMGKKQSYTRNFIEAF